MDKSCGGPFRFEAAIQDQTTAAVSHGRSMRLPAIVDIYARASLMDCTTTCTFCSHDTIMLGGGQVSGQANSASRWHFPHILNKIYNLDVSTGI